MLAENFSSQSDLTSPITSIPGAPRPPAPPEVDTPLVLCFFSSFLWFLLQLLMLMLSGPWPLLIVFQGLTMLPPPLGAMIKVVGEVAMPLDAVVKLAVMGVVALTDTVV